MSKSKVVLVKSKSLSSGGAGDQRILGTMLSRGISVLYDGIDPDDAWRKLCNSTGRVGMKTNCAAGRNMSTSVELTVALADKLVAAGKPERDMIIWDRQNRELKSAGYTLNYAKNGVRCFGTDTRDVGYASSFHSNGKVASLVTNILEMECDHLFNLPILKDHSLAGVSGAMKNLYGAIHNPNKYHDNNCDPYVAELSALPIIKGKSSLVVTDMTRMQYHGGPGFRGSYVVKYGAVIMSFDAVAIDAIGGTILDRFRRENDMQTLAESGRPPKWLVTAEMLGLGNADPANIELIEIEVD
ncbi:MAG: DUF362 domain-containing protein [Candidatus Zixiibacteriota bacterium]